MRKILQRNEKVELNSFIEEFVKIRQKYFTPGQEWLQMAGMAHGGSPCNILLYRNFTIIPAGAQQGECRFFGADSAAEWAGMETSPSNHH